jgi:large subunit ribosomal protein L29
MAIIKKNELKDMKKEQIEEKLKELKREMIKINAQRSSKTLPENPGRVKEIQRTIARLLTREHMIEKSVKEVSKEHA